MDLKKELDVLLITYNRNLELKKTIEYILHNNSPIKECDITILDNCSTDGTSEYITELAQEYPNINHIRHNRNIGGNANIARAMELASKTYFWILCDDDALDWTHWDKIEQALSTGKYDVIQVFSFVHIYTEQGNAKQELAKMILNSAFLPANIYRTASLTDTIVFNAYLNIPFLFPHYALLLEMVNNKISYYQIPEDCGIVYRLDVSANSYTRGMTSTDNKHPIYEDMRWETALALSLKLLKDKDTLEHCVNIIDAFRARTLGGFIRDQVLAPSFRDNTYWHHIIAVYSILTPYQHEFLKKVLQNLQKYIILSEERIQVLSVLSVNYGVKHFFREFLKSFRALLKSIARKMLNG